MQCSYLAFSTSKKHRHSNTLKGLYRKKSDNHEVDNRENRQVLLLALLLVILRSEFTGKCNTCTVDITLYEHETFSAACNYFGDPQTDLRISVSF